MGQKDLHDTRRDKGLAALQSAGVVTDAPAAEVVAQLKSAIGKSAPTDVAAIFLLGKIAAQESLDLLREIGKTATDRDVKKELKRALFKLSQRGMALADVAAPDKKPAALFARSAEIEAYMSAVDGGGGRLIWIAKAEPNHGLQVIQAMLHDREGLLRFGGAHMKRKELRAMADDIKQQHGVTMIAIPWEFADQIIYAGYEQGKARGQSGLENFHDIRSLIGTGKPKPVTHPIYAKLEGGDLRDGPWREQSRRLLEEPELSTWLVVDDWMKEYLGQIEAARASPLVLNPMQKEQRLGAIVRDAVKMLCAGEHGQAFKRRMEDTALYFYETGRVEPAKLSLAVAQQVGAGEPGALDISFLTGLIQKSFAFFMSQEKAQQEKAESSLIVKP